MTPKELENTAHQLIAEKISMGEPVQLAWAVQELISRLNGVDGFFNLCAREHGYRVLKAVVDKYPSEGPSEEAQQMPLIGFEYLQQAYSVELDGVRQLVPIYMLSDHELLTRANEFDKQSVGLTQHAREIRDYVETRRSKKTMCPA